MLKQFAGESCLGELNEDNLKASHASNLHGRQTVGITRYQDDAVHRSVVCVVGNVQAEPHVYAFLFKSRPEIIVLQLAGCVFPLFESETSKLQRPQPHCKLRFGGQNPKPAGIRPVLFGLT